MAGFFAFIYGAFMLGGSAVRSAKIDTERTESKKRAVDNNLLTYHVRGEQFFTENDLPCITTRNHQNGHKVIMVSKGIEQGKILYDYDEVHANKENDKYLRLCEDAKAKGMKYVATILQLNESYPECKTGIEVETHKKYVIYGSSSINTFFLQYLTDEPKQIYVNNNYVYVYEPVGERTRITRKEYMERNSYL